MKCECRGPYLIVDVGELMMKDKTVQLKRAAGAEKVAAKDREERIKRSMALICNLVTLKSTTV